MPLQNKTALIYGVTSALGRDIVKHLRKMNANVVFSAPDDEETRNLVSSLQAQYVFLKDAQTDNHWSIQSELISLAVQNYHSIDFVLSMAGVLDTKGLDMSQYTQLTETALELNLTSLITLNRLSIRQFIKQGGSGCVINACPLSGVCGYISDPLFFATKSAITGITKSYASLLEATDIRINCIVPDIKDMSFSVLQAEDTFHIYGNLDIVPSRHYIEATLSIVKNTNINGSIVVVSQLQYLLEPPSYNDPLYEKLHHLSQGRKNGFLDKVKHQLLNN